MAFHGLATLIRYAATDMGIHIDINLERLALDDEGRSEQHYAVGRIDYGDGEEGVLLYMKLSIGKNELPYIENYRRANPDFPHQSTADQFFDEAQFEAYRALGFKVGMRTLEALKHQESFVGDGPLSFGIHRSMKPASEDVPDWTSHARPAADPERPW
jgi:uncharacterized short protein YbdD (DUF466 family)